MSGGGDGGGDGDMQARMGCVSGEYSCVYYHNTPIFILAFNMSLQHALHVSPPITTCTHHDDHLRPQTFLDRQNHSGQTALDTLLEHVAGDGEERGKLVVWLVDNGAENAQGTKAVSRELASEIMAKKYKRTLERHTNKLKRLEEKRQESDSFYQLLRINADRQYTDPQVSVHCI